MKISIIYNILDQIVSIENFAANLKNIDKNYIEIIFIIQKKSKKTFDLISGLNLENASMQIFLVSSNEGLSYGLNMGIQMAKHDYLIFAIPNFMFSNDFNNIIIEINTMNSDVVFFDGLQNGDEATFKESFRHRIVSVWNMMVSKDILMNNKIFFHDYTKMFFDFIYELIKVSKKITIRQNKLIDTPNEKFFDHNSYDILVDASKIFFRVESLKNKDDIEYYKALASIMIIHEFLFQIWQANSSSDTLKYAIKNANIVINNIYPEYKNNKYLNIWKNEKAPKFVLEFIPTLKYCLKEL